jgi:exonuclease III
MDHESIFWNVWGLNTRARREVVVASLVAEERVSLHCLQETKLSVIDNATINLMLGTVYDYAFVPAAGTGWGAFLLHGALPFGRG